jgi:phospholipid/cholesterol/gamma-HCH transport system substrate-binding protein
MASIKTKLVVGIFVMIGFALASVSILWLGMSNYFERGSYCIAYFDESVQGLDKDSPVKYRGVPIGRVESINVAPDSTLIQVVMKIKEGLELEEHLEKVVAQLKSVGITGIMFIELDRKKPLEPDRSPKLTFPSKYPVVATKPSEMKKFMEELYDMLNLLRSMDLKGIASRIKSTLEIINQSVEDIQVKKLSSNIIASFEKIQTILDTGKWKNIIDNIEQESSALHNLTRDANKTVTRINKLFSNNEQGFHEAISDFKLAMKNASLFLEKGSGLIKSTDGKLSNLQQQLIVTLKNLEKASVKLNTFLELISEQPSRLIFGGPSPSRKVELDKKMEQ